MADFSSQIPSCMICERFYGHVLSAVKNGGLAVINTLAEFMSWDYFVSDGVVRP